MRGQVRLGERAGGEDAITAYLGGYHRCFLDNPIHMEFISVNLCKMLGYSRLEVDALIGDNYTCLMHPEDAQRFDLFIQGFSGQEKCESIMYRLVRNDGTPVVVVDTTASRICEDGHLRGHAVVCEIPEEVAGRPRGSFSILRVSDGPRSIISSLNRAASEMLAIPGSSSDFMFIDFVSINDRGRIEKAFERASKEEYSGKEPCVIIGADGASKKAMVWVQLAARRQDGCDFCVLIEDEAPYHREHESDRSLSRLVLSNLSEDVFEVDVSEGSIKRVSSQHPGLIDWPFEVRMFVQDALWAFCEHVLEEDQQTVADFFECAMTGGLKPDDGNLARIRFGIANGDGTCQVVEAAVVPITASKFFICLYSSAGAAGYENSNFSVAVRKRISIRMFGSFSIMVDGRSVRLKHDKSKELLALLVEKRGAYLSSREAIGALWECPPDERSRARYRKVASRLMADLKEIGVDYIVESERGSRRVVPELIECDYYEYLDGRRPATGAFLPEYSWSEFIRL